MKMKKKLRNSVALGVVLLSMVACTGKPLHQSQLVVTTDNVPNNVKMNVIKTTVKIKKK